MEITQEQIKEWQNARIKNVNDSISAILARENCELQAVPSITPDGRLMAQIVIVPK